MSIKKIALATGVAAMMTATSAYASVIDRPFFKVLGVVIVWGADDTAANSGTAPIASDFALLTTSNAAGVDLIAGDVYTVVTGTLDPIAGDEGAANATIDPITGQTSGGVFTDDGNGILDAADSLTAFGVDSATDVDGALVAAHTSTFYVASNATFDIRATASPAVTTGDFSALDLDNITFGMAVDASAQTVGGLTVGGAAAQVPGTVITSIDSLDDLAGATPVPVFTGTQRTAAARGSIAEQSVAFNLTYALTDPNETAGDTGYDLSMGNGSITSDVTFTVYAP